MRKKVLVAVAVIAGMFLVLVAVHHADYGVVRSTTVSAPPAVVFAQVKDLHKWEAWSPWAKLDPGAKNTFEASPAGNVAGFTWAGNHKASEGRMTITESRPNDLIRIKLDFVKPLASTAIAELTFKPEDNQTRVTWNVAGRADLLHTSLHLFTDNLDRIIGEDLENGLANLKSVSEAAANK